MILAIFCCCLLMSLGGLCLIDPCRVPVTSTLQSSQSSHGYYFAVYIRHVMKRLILTLGRKDQERRVSRSRLAIQSTAQKCVLLLSTPVHSTFSIIIMDITMLIAVR